MSAIESKQAVQDNGLVKVRRKEKNVKAPF